MRFLPRFSLALCLLAVSAKADSVWLQDVEFSVTHAAGLGNAVFVSGNCPQLGNSEPTLAVRLNWSEGNVWHGTVALPRGITTTWRAFVRGESAAAFTNTPNITWIGQNTTSTPPPPPPAPYPGKTITYETGWATPHILWNRPGTSDWINTPLTPVRPGVFRLELGEAAGRPMQFVPNSGAGQWDNPGGVSGVNYNATADAIWLRSGQIYDYEPPATVSAPRFVTNNITSSYTGIPSRRVRVQLPRGYDQNTNKLYPVIYFHDGQNVFDPGGAFGSWSADAIITRDTAAGLLREMIVVAVDNSNARLNEYRPPGDNYNGSNGIGDRYRDFLVNDVKPWVDANFRISPRPEDHALAGSSLGGLITHYIGMTSDAFGLLGVCSPSYWIAPNFRAAIAAAPKPDRRIWLDWGSSEGASMWEYSWPAASTLDSKGMVRGRDLQVMVGAGDAHNEAAWRRRLPSLLRFLLPLTDGPNHLLFSQVGTPTAHGAFAAEDFVVSVPALRGFHYDVEAKGSLDGPAAWQPITSQVATDPWSVLMFPNTVQDTQRFYRIGIR